MTLFIKNITLELQELDLRETYYDDLINVHDLNPKWWMRWGIMIVFTILFIIILLSCIIKYPDIISSPFTVESSSPSVVIPKENNAQIERVFVKDQEVVSEGRSLLLFKNNSKYEDIMELRDDLDNLKFRHADIIKFYKKYENGESEIRDIVENDWIRFMKTLSEYYKIKEFNVRKKRIDIIEVEKKEKEKKISFLQEIITYSDEEMKYVDLNFNIDSLAYLDSLISRKNYNSSVKNKVNSEKQFLLNKLSLQEEKSNLLLLDNAVENIRIQEEEKVLSIYLELKELSSTLKRLIRVWENQFVIKAPVAGKVQFLKHIKNKLYVSGDIFVITPHENNSFFGYLEIPVVGAGKIELNQEVILKLSNYPYREYGVLKGKLIELNKIPNNDMYIGKVEFLNMELSSHDKIVNVEEKMTGLAEIITFDRSLIERILENVLYVFRK